MVSRPALAEMHGRLADGTVLVGVPVFAEAYRRAGLPRLAWVISQPWLQPGLRYGYTFFARHRQRIARLLGGPLHRLVARTTIVSPETLSHHVDRT